MHTLKVTHDPNRREFWQFIAIINTARTWWAIRRWEPMTPLETYRINNGYPQDFRVDCHDAAEMGRVLNLYEIPYINTNADKEATR